MFLELHPPRITLSFHYELHEYDSLSKKAYSYRKHAGCPSLPTLQKFKSLKIRGSANFI